MHDAEKSKAQPIAELTAPKRETVGPEDSEQIWLRGRIALSLQRVRDDMHRMETPDDWEKVGLCVDRELRRYLDFRDFSILVKAPHEEGLFSFYFVGKDQRSQAGYNPDFRLENNRAIKEALATETFVYRRNRREIEQYGDPLLPEVQSVVDVPFRTGTLGVNSAREDSFAPGDMKILQEFAAVLSEAYHRLEDLQHLRNQEEQLRQAQKMEAIGRLTAGVAHNFNNMLMSILGNTNIAQMEAPPALQGYLGNIEKAALNGADMVRQLMAYSRQGLHPEYEPVDLTALIERTAGLCRETFDPQISLDIDIQAALPTLLGNGDQIEQVFLNLLVNARDAVTDIAERQPAIGLQMEKINLGPEAKITAADKRSGTFVRVQIADNGVGMDEETQHHIFEPFFTTKDVGKGIGLGLSTVYGIVNQHGGWIECASQPEVGTTFSVYLPAARQESDERRIAAAAESKPEPSKNTILIIDDEEMVRHSIGRMLERQGHTVLTAEDGIEGLEVFKSNAERIALILLDLSMPRMSGQETLVHLLAFDPQVKVVIFTGHIAVEEELEGAVDRIEKPIDSISLAQKIQAVLEAQ